MRKQYSAEFEAQIVKEVLKEEKTLNEIASECGVHPKQVRQWREKALAALPGVFSRKGEEEQAENRVSSFSDQERIRDQLQSEIGLGSEQA